MQAVSSVRTLVGAFSLLSVVLAGMAAPALGTEAVFSTYLSNGFGPTYEVAAVATDSSGAVYVTGSYAPLPYFPYPWDQTPFVMKLSPEGEVLYTTIFPGTGTSMSEAIAVDDQGQAYIAGYTDDTLPQIGGLDASYRGTGYEAFIAKLGPAGEILYSTTLGTSARDMALGIGVDAQGTIYVAGITESASFPRVGSVSLPASGGGDAFIAKLIPGSPAPVWSAPFGGSALESLENLDADSAGNVYLTGYTQSTDFPTAAAFQAVHGGGYDAFALKLTSSGKVVYSTFLGGALGDFGLTVAADSAGNAWLGGYTESGDFPLKNPLQDTLRELSFSDWIPRAA